MLVMSSDKKKNVFQLESASQCSSFIKTIPALERNQIQKYMKRTPTLRNSEQQFVEHTVLSLVGFEPTTLLRK